jgi:hypothetical protein
MSKTGLRFRRSGLCLASLAFFTWLLAGCGGGGGTTPPPPPPPPGDFSISAAPTSLTLGLGGSQTVDVSATEINTFTASINVSVSGLPAGVTANPATFSLTPGNQQQLTIAAAASAQPLTATLIFKGTSGSLSHSAQTSLSIVVPVTGVHPPIRTQYLRTNSFYDPNDAPPHFTVYDVVHKQFFVSNPFLNEIDVFDAAQEVETAQIPIPFAWGLDVSPYNGSLYAGTLIGDIYQIDTSTLSITSRYPSASIGPNGFTATTALALSDGRLALQGGIGEGAILGVDGNGVSVAWDPVTNSMDTGTNGSVCDVGNEGAFAVSGDRTRILVTFVDSSASAPLCSYDPIAKIATYGSLSTPSGSFVRQIIPTPDGARFFLTTALEGVAVFDAKTVQLLGQITGPYPGLPNAPSGAVMSRDGKTLYLLDQSSGAVGAFDTTSLTQTGWVPSFAVMDSESGVVVSAIDETGLIVGPTGHGVGFVDASQMTNAEPTLITPGGSASPSTGPSAGGTTITGFANGNVTDSSVVSQIYVGNMPGAFPTFATSPGHENTAQVTTPPSLQTGAVDLAVVLSDGGVGVAPEGFSYGPTILEVVPNGATAEGGQTGTVIGYGFGDSTSGVQVTVGGQSAPVTAVYNYAPISPYPFPTNELQFTIPPGTAGAAVDFTVTTASGSVTATGGFHYTAAVQSYPLAANLQSGIYDAGRDLYYFADKAQIQVLSKSTGTWLSPISLPGVSSKTQLLAISESPDGTKLAVSDYGDQAIYVLNPDIPASAKSYSMSLDNDGYSASLAPSGLAVTDGGLVYFYTADTTGTGTPAFHKLNTAAGSIIDLGYSQGLSSGGLTDEFVRVILSPDGSKVFCNIEGTSFWLDTSNDLITYFSAFLSEDFPDLAVSGDGSTIDIAGEWTNAFLDPEIVVVYVDWETWFPLAANGQKVNQDGSILFSPLTDGIDMIARNTGRLLYRIQIPLTPANVYDVLVVAEGQNTLAVISSTGVSFVDLTSLPIAQGYTHPFANNVDSRTGSLADRPPIQPTKRSLSTRSSYWMARPKLRHRADQSKAHFRTP